MVIETLLREQHLYIGPTHRLSGTPIFPSSKYYTLRYVLAAALSAGDSYVIAPAESDDSDALWRGCRALGAELTWQDEQHHVLRVRGVGEQLRNGVASGPTTINVGNAGAVARLLLGIGALLPQVTFLTDHPQSLGKRPNRELLEALTTLGANCEGTGSEGYLPITLRRGNLHGGQVTISGARSSQYLSALLFLAPLLTESLEITVTDMLKSQPLVRATLEVLHDAGIRVQYDAPLRHFVIPAHQQYQARTYTIPGDYPSAAALIAACAVMPDATSALHLAPLRPGEEIGEDLLAAFQQMQVALRREGESIIVHGGSRLRGITLNGDTLIDCIPVLVAAACFAEGESVFYNIESLHYKESDRINDLCAELQRAGCAVTPKQDAIIVQGRPDGISGGVTVDGHSDHRLLMAFAIAALRSQQGLTLTGIAHIAKSYPRFFEELQALGAQIIR